VAVGSFNGCDRESSNLIDLQLDKISIWCAYRDAVGSGARIDYVPYDSHRYSAALDIGRRR
jgi:hypothetical protein